MRSLLNTLRTSAGITTFALISVAAFDLRDAAFACTIYDREQLGLHGPVRLVVERQHEGQPFVFFLKREFDSQGRLLETVSRSERNGKFLSAVKGKASHDRRSNIRKEESYWIEADRLKGDRVRTTLCAYDAEGNMMAEATSGEDGLFESLVVRTYDNRGNWVTEIRYIRRFPFLQSMEAAHRYDQAGKVTQRVITQRDGSKSVERYDKQGLLIESTEYSATDELKSRLVITRDDHGNEREFIRYGPDSEIDTRGMTSYTYDLNGNWVVKQFRLSIKDKEAVDEVNRMSRTITYHP